MTCISAEEPQELLARSADGEGKWGGSRSPHKWGSELHLWLFPRQVGIWNTLSRFHTKDGRSRP